MPPQPYQCCATVLSGANRASDVIGVGHTYNQGTW
jgi:hypothetical protein